VLHAAEPQYVHVAIGSPLLAGRRGLSDAIAFVLLQNISPMARLQTRLHAHCADFAQQRGHQIRVYTLILGG